MEPCPPWGCGLCLAGDDTLKTVRRMGGHNGSCRLGWVETLLIQAGHRPLLTSCETQSPALVLQLPVCQEGRGNHAVLATGITSLVFLGGSKTTLKKGAGGGVLGGEASVMSAQSHKLSPF